MVKYLIIFFAALTSITSSAQLKIANFGNYELENGQHLKDTRIGYQTFGKLNAEKTNAILFPTWYGGTGESLKPYLGKETMIDTTKYHVIIVEALGNGISSSPSNTQIAENSDFPEYMIQDLVDLQHKLLTEVLGIEHLYAVTGISMGGMQTYQWMASYPSFFDKAIPIVGSPELSVYDKLNYRILKNLLIAEMKNPNNNATFLMLEYSLGLTPQYFEDFEESDEEFLEKIKEEAKKYSVVDLYSQMLAISDYDPTKIIRENGKNSLADVYLGEVLIIYSSSDNLVSPYSNQRLIELMNAKSLDLNSVCGHYAFGCDIEKISLAVKDFLN